MENNEKFKLLTRRLVGLPMAISLASAVTFAIVWSTVHGIMEIFTGSIALAGTWIGMVLTYYFSTKTKEE